jgi:hypothetical protein
VTTLGSWRWVVPVLGAALAVAWPFGRYALKVRAERTALEAVERIREAQTAFRTVGGRGAFAVSLESLTAPCDGAPAPLSLAVLADLASQGYEATLRLRNSASPSGADCHGRPTAPDYYLSVQPVDGAVAGQRAYAATAASEPYVFFDGVAPREEDIGPGGLAVPASALATFRIP